MPTRIFKLPEAARLRAKSQGEIGERWLAGLPQLVQQLEKNWAIRVGAALTGGSESLTAEAQCSDGTPAILKIGLADLADEARVYRMADGRGYAKLMAYDETCNALLLERLGKPLAEMGLTVSKQIEVICATLREAWMPLSSASGLMTGAEKAAWLAEFISEKWTSLDGPCDKRTIDQALTFAEERAEAFSARDAVLVHGDAHSHNTLTLPGRRRDEEIRCKFVDPDGLFAERAYDLAIPMRDWDQELLAGDALQLGKARCALLAEMTGVDEHAIWQWGFIERVSTGLLLIELGMQTPGFETLAVADRWLTR